MSVTRRQAYLAIQTGAMTAPFATARTEAFGHRRIPTPGPLFCTNLSGGTVPHRGGIVLALTRISRLLEVSQADLVAVCQPGVRTIELAQAAGAKGLLFPPDPGSHTTATIGGNVAECAGGLRALKYGVTRDYVLGVQAVLATGEVIRSGGRLVKDVVGYDYDDCYAVARARSQ